LDKEGLGNVHTNRLVRPALLHVERVIQSPWPVVGSMVKMRSDAVVTPTLNISGGRFSVTQYCFTIVVVAFASDKRLAGLYIFYLKRQ
jgi:hypothetical protein